VCLADLEPSEPTAVLCRRCGHTCTSMMDACPSCLASLRTDDKAELTQVVGRQRVLRSADVAAFTTTPSCTVTRGSEGLNMLFVNGNQQIEAFVKGAAAVCPLECWDVTGDPLFRLETYTALTNAVVATGADGAAIASFVRVDNALSSFVNVRDETSAPVARLQRSSSMQPAWELVETGGPVVAFCDTRDVRIGTVVDDAWSVWPAPGQRVPLKRLGLPALALAAKVLLGNPQPVVVREDGGIGTADAAALLGGLFD
jgi:hypothetical protein